MDAAMNAGHCNRKVVAHPRVHAIKEDACADRLVGTVAGSEHKPFRGSKQRFSDSKAILRFVRLSKLTKEERMTVFLEEVSNDGKSVCGGEECVIS
jgi:hypothetical protein